MDTKDSSLNLPGQKSSPAAKGYGFRYPAIVPQETELRKRSTRMINHSALVCGLALGALRDRTGKVWPGTLLHTLNNLLVFAAG